MKRFREVFYNIFFRSVYEARARLHNSATHENPRYGFRTFYEQRIKYKKEKEANSMRSICFSSCGYAFLC